jgi:hypothetical protein
VLPTLSVSPPVVSRIQTTDPRRRTRLCPHVLILPPCTSSTCPLSGDRERFRFETLGTRTNLLGVDRLSMTVHTEVNPGRALYITRVVGGASSLAPTPVTPCGRCVRKRCRSLARAPSQHTWYVHLRGPKRSLTG